MRCHRSNSALYTYITSTMNGGKFWCRERRLCFDWAALWKTVIPTQCCITMFCFSFSFQGVTSFSNHKLLATNVLFMPIKHTDLSHGDRKKSNQQSAICSRINVELSFALVSCIWAKELDMSTGYLFISPAMWPKRRLERKGCSHCLKCSIP